MQLRRINFTANTVTFAKPDDFTDTVKASVDRKRKVIGTVPLQHVSSQVKINRRASVPTNQTGDCCVVPLYEDLVASITFSGSIENKGAVNQLKLDLLKVLDTVFADITSGFVPLDANLDLPATSSEG